MYTPFWEDVSWVTKEQSVVWSLAYLQTVLQKQMFIERDKASMQKIKIVPQGQDQGEASEVPGEQSWRYITLRVHPQTPEVNSSFDAAWSTWLASPGLNLVAESG